MDRGQLGSRVAALRAEVEAVGRALVEGGSGLEPVEAFELVGGLQVLVNAAEGAQAVAAAWGARVEERLTSAGPVRRVHPLGFTDAMSGSEVALAAGVSEGVRWRKVRLGAGLAERFPMIRDLVVAGEVSAVTAHRVLDVGEGLDVEACREVDAQLAPRLVGLDPCVVTRATRQVAMRVAADQVAAQVAAKKRTRCVEVAAAEDGLTSWWAVLPTATAAAAWSAVEQVAEDYRKLDASLTVPESRADAFGDLLLRNVTVTAKVTLGVPVITDAQVPGTGAGSAAASGGALGVVSGGMTGSDDMVPGAPPGRPGRSTARPGWSRQRLDLTDELFVDHDTGEVTRVADLSPDERERLSWVDVPDAGHPCGGEPASASADPRYQVMSPLDGGCAVSGTELPGLGWVDPATVAAIFATVPVQVGRAVLDAGTGTLVSHTTNAYTPTTAIREHVQTRDGTCRMWGCTRTATAVDLDHVRPWPSGATTPANLAGLCRRHHRMKQRGRWRYRLHLNGTIDWVSQNGQRRVTEPFHRVIDSGTNPAVERSTPSEAEPEATPPRMAGAAAQPRAVGAVGAGGDQPPF